MERTKAKGSIERFSEFADLVEETFNKFKANSSEKLFNKVNFMQEYPKGTHPRDLNLPAITYKMSDREPYDINKKKRHREYLPDENNPGYQITIEGKVYKAEICFDIWGFSNKEVDRLSEDFEDFIHRITGNLKQSGVQEIVFKEDEYDGDTDLDDEVAKRSLKYDVYIERIFVSSTKELEDVRVNVSTSKIIKEDK